MRVTRVPPPPPPEVTITMTEAQAQVLFELLGDIYNSHGEVCDLYQGLEDQGFRHESLEEPFAGYFNVKKGRLARTDKE